MCQRLGLPWPQTWGDMVHSTLSVRMPGGQNSANYFQTRWGHTWSLNKIRHPNVNERYTSLGLNSQGKWPVIFYVVLFTKVLFETIFQLVINSSVIQWFFSAQNGTLAIFPWNDTRFAFSLRLKTFKTASTIQLLSLSRSFGTKFNF